MSKPAVKTNKAVIKTGAVERKAVKSFINYSPIIITNELARGNIDFAIFND